MEDSLPFLSQPFRTAPVLNPQKKFRNTSSDFGVNSPHVLSPAITITLDNSQPYPTPSISQMNPSNGPLTPI